MNAIDIVDRVRKLGAELLVESKQVRVRGGRLPDDLQQEVDEHSADLIIALGTPIDEVASAVLDEMRVDLPPNLAKLPGPKLWLLTRLALASSWSAGVHRLEREQREGQAKRGRSR